MGLAVGQAVSHLMLAAAGHSHGPVPGGAMLAAHLLAVVIGALLITGAERLCRALSTVLGGRAARRAPPPVVRPTSARAGGAGSGCAVGCRARTRLAMMR